MSEIPPPVESLEQLVDRIMLISGSVAMIDKQLDVLIRDLTTHAQHDIVAKDLNEDDRAFGLDEQIARAAYE